MKTAVHNHFTYRASFTNLEFKRLLKQGRTSLFIGLVFLSVCASKQSVGGPSSRHLGSGRTGESYDCWMGRDVSTDADLSLRLVARAATNPDLCQAEPHAGVRPKKQGLSSLVAGYRLQSKTVPALAGASLASRFLVSSCTLLKFDWWASSNDSVRSNQNSAVSSPARNS
jgi:hypothetical protein